MKAVDTFANPTTAINQLWQTGCTCREVTAWGWLYLSTVLDDVTRAWTIGRPPMSNSALSPVSGSRARTSSVAPSSAAANSTSTQQNALQPDGPNTLLAQPLKMSRKKLTTDTLDAEARAEYPCRPAGRRRQRFDR